jgi:hypothetical protein
MVDEKEFEKLKKEHNKTVMWIEFFSHKIDELENEIKKLKEELKEKSEKEEILARTVLKLVEDKEKK